MRKIGILGGGQLARMLCLAGHPLGLQFLTWDRDPQCPASAVSEIFSESFEDSRALSEFAKSVDVITYESENLPLGVLESLNRLKPVSPSLKALSQGQDRLKEKELFTRLGIQTPRFLPVQTLEDLQEAVKELGYPSVLKTRRFGYDGKGQAVLKRSSDLKPAWQKLQPHALILEEFVAFDREVSVIGVRDRKGATAFYPLVENHHHSGILHWSLAPAPKGHALHRQGVQASKKLMQELDYQGVFVVEFFVKKGKLSANEMAPRVHNSGHWTIEGAETSQFENHLRAIAGLPLGSTEARFPSAMVNLIGEIPDSARILGQPGAHLHLYQKAARPGRKLGHITLCGANLKRRLEKLKFRPILPKEK